MGSGGVLWAYGQIFLSVPNWFQAHWAHEIRGSYLPHEKARLSETMGLPWAHCGLQVYLAVSSPSNQSRHIWQNCGFQALLYWVSLGTLMGMGGGLGYAWEVGLLIRRVLFSYFSSVAQLCLTLYDPMSYTVHGILQARILEWVAFLFFRDWTQVSCIAGRFFTSWATMEALR